MPFESVSVRARSDLRGIGPELVAALLLLLAFLASTVAHIFKPNIPADFDELAHVSFVAQIQTCGCLPTLDELRMLERQP